ncbi:MAG: protein kinase domain-containing protein [Longimicrobiales bacterium]
MDLLERVRAALGDRYQVSRKLGEGGMAVVFEAGDSRHGRRVAIKVLRPEVAEQIGADRFLREIRVTAQLSHPHILPLLDSGTADELLYYVMPLVEGETLRERITRQQQLSVQEALRLSDEVADALSYAHGRGILHRDIKPENILLASGHALVADFGIARAAVFADKTSHTATGIALGTPAYMSPEQAAGDPKLDARSDLYSLACVTFEMLTGQPPFTGPAPQVVLARRLHESAPALRTLRESIDRSVDTAVARALSRAPEDRQRSLHEFAQELRAAGNLPAHTSRLRLRTAAGIVLLLAGVVALMIGQRIKSGPGNPSKAQPRLAVLPLENLGHDDDAPFAAGIAEEIMSRLSEIGGLQVVSRTSASRFRERTLSMRELGAQLNADYILEGSVRTDRASSGPGSARVIARLIRVADDVRVWEHPYDAILVPGDIFRVQTEIATRVAAALDLTVGAAERRRVGRITTSDSAAYRLYQLGRFQWGKRDAASLKLAVASFRAAVARDSQFAEAYAGLSDALGASFLLYPDDSVHIARRQALDAAQRAITIDSSLAAAHASLGYGRLFVAWDWAAAEAAFQRAIRLDPGYGPARYWYTQLLWMLGRHHDALAQAEAAVANDPLSGVSYLARARTFRLLGRQEEWAADLRRSTELTQGLAPSWFGLAEYHTMRGEADSARASMQRFLSVRYGTAAGTDDLAASAARALARSGNVAHVLQLTARAGIADPAVGPLAARLYAMTGQLDSAFARLQRMEVARDSELPSILPFLAAELSGDARWAELKRRMAF